MTLDITMNPYTIHMDNPDDVVEHNLGATGLWRVVIEAKCSTWADYGIEVRRRAFDGNDHYAMATPLTITANTINAVESVYARTLVFRPVIVVPGEELPFDAYIWVWAERIGVHGVY